MEEKGGEFAPLQVHRQSPLQVRTLRKTYLKLTSPYLGSVYKFFCGRKKSRKIWGEVVKVGANFFFFMLGDELAKVGGTCDRAN